MLSKAERASRSEITEAVQHGRGPHGGFFSIKKSLRKHAPAAGTVIVAKKVAKTAVLRHRIKRIVHTVLDPIVRSEASPSITVVLVKKAPRRQEEASFSQELAALLKS